MHSIQTSLKGGTWTHFEDVDLTANAKDIGNLAQSEIVTRFLLEWSPRPHCEYTDKGTIIVLKATGLSLNRDITTIAVRAYLWAGNLLTISIKPVPAVQETIEQLKASEPKRADEVVGLIAQKIAIGMRNQAIELVDRLDRLEDDVLDPDISVPSTSLVVFRRNMLAFKRTSRAQVIALEDFVSEQNMTIENDVRAFLGPTISSAAKFDELLDSLSLRCDGLANAIEAESRQKTERTTYLLTLAAGVFLPLNLLAGMFGANVGGVPWLNNDQGFLFFILTLIGLTAFSTVLSVAILRMVAKWRSKQPPAASARKRN